MPPNQPPLTSNISDMFFGRGANAKEMARNPSDRRGVNNMFYGASMISQVNPFD